jgi:hypothetical protein
MKQNIVLAFDIERAGATREYDTIAIGAVVMDSNYNELGRYYFDCYYPETTFEPRCYEQFWSKNQNILEKMLYTGPQSKNEREKEMICGFFEFRKKWEQYAETNNMNYYLVSDNNVFDGGFINELMFKHMSDKLPIPYNASKQEYDTFYETHSIMKGFLLNQRINKEWNLFEEIAKTINVPKCVVNHDHNPANDAYVIAFEMVCLLNYARMTQVARMTQFI